MDALLTAIVLWLSANFALAANYEHPQIKRVSPAELVEIRYRDMRRETLVPLSIDMERKQHDTVSIYDASTRTIYLRKDWSGKTPADLSVIVHEMVHHLQHVEETRFECPQERERLAFKAQDEWLKMFATSLEQEFQVDPFTRLVVTRCVQ